MNNKTNFVVESRFFRGAAVLAGVLSFLLNPLILGKILADDGTINSESLIVKLWIISIAFILLSVGLFIKSSQLSFEIPKQQFFGVLAFGISVLLCLIIVEIFLRVTFSYKSLEFIKPGNSILPRYGHTLPDHFTFDPVTGYSLIPNIKDDERYITTDDHGFRTTGKQYVEGRPSVIFIGDSTVFGWGAKDEWSFPYLLAPGKILESYNVINMGVPSYSLGHIAAVLKNKVPLYNPKIVFVAILWPWKPFEAYSSASAWEKIDFDFYRSTIPLRTDFQIHHSLRDLITPRIYLVLTNYWNKIRFKKQIRENLTRPGIHHFDISESDERQLAMRHVEVLKDAAESLKKSGVDVVFY
jgi:hypothetical protein